MGRPKQFDPDAALDTIKNLFWANGFEGTSLSDIEAATGLPKQSLYREFGDKRAMYLAALRHYEMHEARAAAALLAQHSDPKAAFAALFAHVIGSAGSAPDRRGCFLCNASTDRTTLDPAISEQVNGALERLRAGFAKTLSETAPDYPRASTLLAGYIGLRVMIRAGFPRDVLNASAEQMTASIPA